MAGGGATRTFTVLGTPEVLAPRTLPGHRVLMLTLLNRGPQPALVHAQDLELLDDGGEQLRAVITFDRESAGPGAAVEAKRAALSPGHGVRLVVAWHTGDAARLAYPGGAVELAATSAPRA